MEFTNTPYSELATFVRPYSVAYPLTEDSESEPVDLDNPGPTLGANLPCPAAIEFLADMYEAEGGDNVKKATDVSRRFVFRVTIV